MPVWESRLLVGGGSITPQEECHKGVGKKPVHDGGKVSSLTKMHV